MNLTVRQKRNLMRSGKMMTIENMSKMMRDEFEERFNTLPGQTKRTFDEDCAKAYFERELLMEYLHYTLKRNFTPSKAFEVISGDEETTDMIFEDAIEYAKHGCYL